MYDKFGQFIDGKWQKSSSGETYDVLNPATEEVIGKASKANSSDVKKALKSAEKGLEIWRNTSPWERSKIIRKNEYKKTLVMNGTSLGANCTIICGVSIGKHAFVAAGAVVTKDVKSYALVKGIPARQVGWISEFGENIPLPLEGEGSWTCQKMKSKYSLKQTEIFAEKI